MAILEHLRPQVQADFLSFYSGTDLDQMLGELRFGQILELILQLPDPQSRFWSALNKPEHEELYIQVMGDPAADLDEDTEPEPIVTPYQHAGLTELLLMDVRDGIHMGRSEAAAKGTGQNPKRVKMYPRPVSARDRIVTRKMDENLDELAADLGFGEDL